MCDELKDLQQLLYARPKDLLIYYGYPSCFNSNVNGWDNEKVAVDMAKYGLIVLGDGLQNSGHADHNNTQLIINRIKQLNPGTKIFGYVTTNQDYSTFKIEAEQWDAMGVHGIFMDESGYDFGKDRDEFNERVSFVHSLYAANTVFANAWNLSHIIDVDNDPNYPNSVYNRNLRDSQLNSNDYCLLESFGINTDVYGTNNGYESKASWLERGNKAVRLRAAYDVQIVGNGIINESNVNAQNMFYFGWLSAVMFCLDGFGTSDSYYGASSAKTTFWSRVNLSPVGKIWDLFPVVVEGSNANEYVRHVEFGKFILDFTLNNQGYCIDYY